jgi:hypothetical protein
MKTFKIILSIIAIISLQSCTKSVDFDQLDNAEIHSNYIVTLAYFKLDAPTLLDEFNGGNLIETTIQIPINDVAEDYLEKIELTTFTENSFNREFNVEVLFFDANGNLIYKLNPKINIPKNSGKIKTVIEIPQDDISKVFNTQYFMFLLQMLPSDDGSIILPTDPSILDFQSSMELFLNFRKL